MSKKLYYMSWAEVQEEMSIAGSPEKIAKLGDEIMRKIETTSDCKNRSELTNVELMLKRIMAEIKGAQRWYNQSHG